MEMLSICRRNNLEEEKKCICLFGILRILEETGTPDPAIHMSVFSWGSVSPGDLRCSSFQGYHVLDAQSSGAKCTEVRELPGLPETLGVQPPVRQEQTLRSRRPDGFCFGCDLSCTEKLERCSAD